jgi:hypothetical protein
VENAELADLILVTEHEEFKQLRPYMSKTMEANPEETTVTPVKEESIPSSLDRVKGWWGSYQQFVAGAVFGVSAILLGSFLRARRN